MNNPDNIWAILVVGTLLILGIIFIVQSVFGAEITPSSTVPEYILEIKFETCHTMFDIYNLTDYYGCIEG